MFGSNHEFDVSLPLLPLWSILLSSLLSTQPMFIYTTVLCIVIHQQTSLFNIGLMVFTEATGPEMDCAAVDGNAVAFTEK